MTSGNTICKWYDRRQSLPMKHTGEGITPEVLTGLATPFNSHKVNGTGLGLYLVQEIVEQHGGRLDIRSLRGEGTSVIISLRSVLRM